MGRKRCCCNQSSSSSSSSSSGFTCDLPATISVIIAGCKDGYVDQLPSNNCTRDYSHWNGTYVYDWSPSLSESFDIQLSGIGSGCTRTTSNGRLRITGTTSCLDNDFGVNNFLAGGNGTPFSPVLASQRVSNGFVGTYVHAAYLVPTSNPFLPFALAANSDPFTITVVVNQ